MSCELLIAVISGYFMGSIPFGLISTRLAGLGDIRKVGSGNIGATNAMRVGGVGMFALVAALDMLKSAAAFYFFGVWGGLASVVGHCYPVWLGFKGGKGVSSIFGFLIAMNPVAFAACGLAWLAVAFATGYSSLAAYLMFPIMPLFGFAESAGAGWACVALGVLGLWRGRANIRRLISGTESKMSFGKK